MSLPTATHELLPISEIIFLGSRSRAAASSTEAFLRDDFLVTFGNAAYTIALPLANENPGRLLCAKIIQTGNSGSVKLDTLGADTIDGLNDFTFNGYNSSVLVQSLGGTAWAIIGYFDGGYEASSIRSITATPTTILTTGRDSTILVDSSAGVKTVILPKVLENIGRKITIKNIGENVVTVDGDGSETIDGALTFPLSLLNQAFQFQAFTTGWFVI